MLYIVLGVCGVMSHTIMGQNLVPNSGFEEFEECPKSYSIKGKGLIIPFWYSPSKGTPDYFNACSKLNVSIPVNFMGNLFAKEGNAYMGILLGENPDRINDGEKPYNEREYIQVMLSTPLEKGEKYEVSFNYAVAERSSYSADKLGVCLSPNPVKGKRIIDCNPVVIKDTVLHEDKSGYWTEVSDTIVAQGGENYLTIGNFYSDCETKFIELDNSELRSSIRSSMNVNRFSYYFIDAVLVEKIED